ncbi:MAG TPA: PDZ domain-containing protein, partial [Candidatus Saccharimonadales bacterium]|nr:PDZ domain-containing protein [Candidatus Saccharimonadales bacterium]
NLTSIDLGDSSNLKVGQFVVAIGTALGEFRNTVTTGVVSGLGRGIAAGDPLAGAVEQLDNVIQTDAAINPGNSGVPLLNSFGQVIGINVAVAAGAQNIGFAIPVSTVRDAISQFSANGKFPAKAFLGIQYQMVTKQAALLNSVPQGALVGDVVAGSAADEAGIKVDDIIVEFDGAKIDSDVKLSDLIAKKKVGDKINVKIYRDGDTKDLTVTLKELGGQ